MAKIFPKVNREESTGERFSRAFSSASRSAAQEIPSYYLNKREQESKRSEKDLLDKQKNYAKVRSAAKSGLSLYDKNKAFDSEMIGRLEELMHSYIDKGFSPDEAFTESFGNLTRQSQQEREALTKSNTFKDKIMELGTSVKEYPESATRLLAQMGRKGVGAIQGISDILTPKNTSPVQGLIPHGRQTMPNEGGLPLAEFYDKLVGEKGIPRNAQEQIGSSVIFGPSGLLGEAASVGIEKLGLPEWAQHLGNIGVMLLSQSGFNKFSKGKEALKKVANISKKTGVPADDIIKSTGVDLAKVAAGDEAAISELSQKITEAPSVYKKVKETPKSVYNKEAAAREREVFGQKLPESPLEEYYEIRDKEFTKQANKRPETKARDLEIRERLQPEESKLFEDLRNEKDKLTTIGRERLRAGPSESERVNSLYEYQKHKIDNITEKLKDVQYEMKYGRPRPTEAEIDAQIQQSVQKYVDAIENPSENLVDATRQIDLDRKYLERASKILERGELPGEIRPDTFMKMKKKYLDGYNAAIQKNQQIVDALKGSRDAASIKKAQQSQELINSLNPRIKRLESDLINQADNIKSMRALESPSGAFYKQQIKSLRKDLERFDYDLFKQKRIKNPVELKAQKVFREHAGEIEKGKQLGKNPTKEQIKEAAEQAGKSESEFSKALKEMKEGAKDIQESVKNGTVTPNTENEFIQKVKKLGKYIGAGLAVGAVEGVLEETFGVKMDNKLIRALFTALKLGSFGSTSQGKKFVRDYFDQIQANELKDLRGDFRSWNKYLKNMELKYGKAKKNRVLNLANKID